MRRTLRLMSSLEPIGEDGDLADLTGCQEIAYYKIGSERKGDAALDDPGTEDRGGVR
jgi:hypothetical protein